MMLKARNDKLQQTSNKLDVIQSNQQSLQKRLDSCYGNTDDPQAKLCMTSEAAKGRGEGCCFFKQLKFNHYYFII